MSNSGRFSAIILLAVLTSCGGGAGGGGGTSTPVLTYSPTAAPSISPTTAPSNLPSTAPTTTPSQQPSEAVVVSPANDFNFYAIGASYAQTVSVTEPGYTGSFTAVNSTAAPCSGIVTIAALSTAGEFSITPMAPGYCLFEFEDSNKNGGAVYIEVTTSQVITE